MFNLELFVNSFIRHRRHKQHCELRTCPRSLRGGYRAGVEPTTLRLKAIRFNQCATTSYNNESSFIHNQSTCDQPLIKTDLVDRMAASTTSNYHLPPNQNKGSYTTAFRQLALSTTQSVPVGGS